MANCNDLFGIFLGRISLTPTKTQYLRDSRDAIREKIRKHFKDELKRQVPKFWGQGSYSMGTLIVPLDGEYDIDDGAYLQCLDKDKGKWPPCATVHSWIYAAVKNHTDQEPVDKNTCVRVIYANQYHVDVPAYGQCEETYYLCDKGQNGWHPSNPRGLTDWFKNELNDKNEQLRSVVKYLKAWADYKSSEAKMPSGLLLTVLASNHYESFERDDSCFSRTASNILKQVKSDFTIYNPVDEKERLSDRLSETQKEIFKILLEDIVKKAAEALKQDSKKESSKIWKTVFGERFPISDDDGKQKLFTSGPALLKDDGRSA